VAEAAVVKVRRVNGVDNRSAKPNASGPALVMQLLTAAPTQIAMNHLI
jgi:hypothetical protein